MYGWRGRIGVILPADNAVLEPDFSRLVPDGVSTHVARLRKSPRSEMPINALQEAKTLVRTRVNVIAYMCAASSFLLGPAKDQALSRDLSEASGLPSFTASTAMVAGLSALGARRVAVLAPHPPEIAQSLKTYLQESGFETSTLSALGLELGQINDLPPGTIYRAVAALDLKGADAIFIAATNFRALDVIEDIERDFGLPVVTSNQVALWMALKTLRVSAARPGFGRLLSMGA